MKFGIAAVTVCLLCIAAGLVVGQDGETVGLKGLAVPLEYYPDGTLKALLKAETATVDSTGESIKGEVLRYETYAEGGATDVVITAEQCLYDKKTGQAKSDSRIKLEKDSVVIMGKGFKLNTKKEMISLHSEVVVEFERNLVPREKK